MYEDDIYDHLANMQPPGQEWNKARNMEVGMKMIKDSGIDYEVFNNGYHVKIGNIDYYPSTGKYRMNGYTYAPKWNCSDYVDINVNEMIDNLSQRKDNDEHSTTEQDEKDRTDWFNRVFMEHREC